MCPLGDWQAAEELPGDYGLVDAIHLPFVGWGLVVRIADHLVGFVGVWVDLR